MTGIAHGEFIDQHEYAVHAEKKLRHSAIGEAVIYSVMLRIDGGKRFGIALSADICDKIEINPKGHSYSGFVAIFSFKDIDGHEAFTVPGAVYDDTVQFGGDAIKMQNRPGVARHGYLLDHRDSVAKYLAESRTTAVSIQDLVEGLSKKRGVETFREESTTL